MARSSAAGHEDLVRDLPRRVHSRERSRRARHLRQACAVAEQRSHLARQPRRAQLAVWDRERGARLGHPARVGALMIARGVRVGNQDRRHAMRGDLEDRPPGARDDEVRGSQRVGEVGLLEVLDQAVSRAQLVCGQLRIVTSPAYVQHPEGALAAYNAGEDRIAAWKAERNYEEIPELVESIPFTQTREYVQIVLRNAQLYRMIYATSANVPASTTAAASGSVAQARR